MSTLKSSVDQCAKIFCNLVPGWHTGFAGPKGNASTAATIEALNLR